MQRKLSHNTSAETCSRSNDQAVLSQAGPYRECPDVSNALYRFLPSLGGSVASTVREARDAPCAASPKTYARTTSARTPARSFKSGVGCKIGLYVVGSMFDGPLVCQTASRKRK